MSVPIVIVFERHWDTIPKLLVKDLLPGLASKGYGNLCFEAPQDLTSSQIIDQHNSELELDVDMQKQAETLLRQVGITKKLSDMSFGSLAELMRLYVSSKKYETVAGKIKQLSAFRILKDIFDEAAKIHLSVKGIDIRSEDFNRMASSNLFERMMGIRENEEYRITTIFENLLKLRAQQEKGIIFVCGASHASGLLAKFKERNMHDEVLYYFPHSSSRYDDSLDDIKEVLMNDTLQGHTHLLTKERIRPFSKKIVKEITGKIKYVKEIADGNSHSQFLSQCFKTNFRAFLRPGHYVDALVGIDDTPNIESIMKRVNEVGVQTHSISLNERRYLVVPGVNTSEIANRIRKIT